MSRDREPLVRPSVARREAERDAEKVLREDGGRSPRLTFEAPKIVIDRAHIRARQKGMKFRAYMLSLLKADGVDDGPNPPQ